MALSPRGNNKGDRCPICSKRVYDIEKLVVDSIVFHRGCLKCATCSTTLKAGALSTDGGKYYCKQHGPARPTVQRVMSSGGSKTQQISQPKREEEKKPAEKGSDSGDGAEARERREKREKGKRETSKRDLEKDVEGGHKQRGTARNEAPPDSVRSSAMIEHLASEVKRLEAESAAAKSMLKKSESKRKSMKKEMKRLDQSLVDLRAQTTAATTAATDRTVAAEKRIEDLQGQLNRILDLLGKLQTAVTAAKPAASPNTTPKTERREDPKGGASIPNDNSNGSDISKKPRAKGVRFAEEDGTPSPTGSKLATNGGAAASDDGGEDEGSTDQTGIKALFKFKRKIGKGATAVVYEARNKKSNQRVAVKKIKKSLIKDEQSLWNELDIVRALHHPNIVAYLEHHEDSEHYYIVMELVDGKELFEKILEKGFYSERDAQRLVIQLLDAIIYLHEQGIAHRDLKPENLLTSGEGEKEVVKVTDFGLSKCFKEAPLKTMCGSSVYIAPEVVEGGHYDTAVDLWSLGVIVYILLCGYPPWKNPPERATQLIMEILACQYSFHEEDWRDISPEAKAFIQHLIVKDPKARMSAKEARSHPWIKKRLEDGKARQNLDRTMSRLEIFLRGEGAPADWEITYKTEMSPLLTQPIAEGAFAFVYKVNWKGRPVAVKKIKFEKDETDEEEMTEDFKKEVEIMSKLKHDNIVQFVGATIHFPNLCIVTEWYDRGSLNDLLHRKSVEFDWTLKVKLCMQVAQGLNYLHTRNPKIIHRDIKAENVFIDAHWTAKLGDFGLSKIKLDSKAIMRRIESQRAVGKMYKTPLESRIEISKSGTVGTPAWIAPEILDMKPYSERADVYSYGVFLWEVLTRRLPHSDKGDYSIAMGVLTQDERPEIPSDTPTKFAQLMRDCWAPRSEDRLSTEAIIATFQKLGTDKRSWE